MMRKEMVLLAASAVAVVGLGTSAGLPERARKDFSRYLAEISYMDSQVGEILTALLQYADVAPTLLELAGGSPGEFDFDGDSFVAVLHGEPEHRRYVYSIHNNLPEGPPYPIRSVTDGRFHYIRNLLPDEIYIEKHLMAKETSHDYWDSWVGDDPLSKPGSYQLVKRYMSRPAEELYLIEEDPLELNNLADDPDYREIRTLLGRALDAWMEEQQDPGHPVDTREALGAARKGKHLHGRALNRDLH